MNRDFNPMPIIVIMLAALLFAAGMYFGAVHTHDNIVKQCVKNERFFDRSLRYFCTPWPADKPVEEETYEDDSDLATMIQS